MEATLQKLTSHQQSTSLDVNFFYLKQRDGNSWLRIWISQNQVQSLMRELKLAIKDYHHLRKSVKELRISYLEKKAEAMELEGGKYSNHLK